MDLYLATDSGRLQQAMACTAQLAHMSYRIGPEGTLLASPLPDSVFMAACTMRPLSSVPL